jgi:ATP-dependent Clp protease ATP-binding subunit ClpC
MRLAGEEARHMNHDYVGTEHILLALVADESGEATKLFHVFGIEQSVIRNGIESLVQRGSQPVTSREIPLTPRAQAALDYARQEALSVNEKLVDTEHLLLGLMREPDGVAGHVLVNLGLHPADLRAEALRIRISLMKIVERAVRPVRASVVRKRKMREELFAHLTAIYEQELAQLGDPAAALATAERRFGESADLACELDRALPYYERTSQFVERYVLYRAPETATRYSLRLAGHTLVMLLVTLGLVFGGVWLRYGWTADVQTLLRVFAAIVLLTPPAQFAVGLAYIKMRDALWGAFGNRKSLGRALALAILIAVVAELYLMGVAGVARLDLAAAIDAARLGGMIAVISAAAFAVLAYLSGPTEIRDTQWALLDIEAA